MAIISGLGTAVCCVLYTKYSACIFCRSIFRPVYPLVITITFYILLILFGLVGNFLILAVVKGKKLLKDNTQVCNSHKSTLCQDAFICFAQDARLLILFIQDTLNPLYFQLCMMNMALAFLAQLIFVIPFSLFVLVVHNWLLGYFMCYALPMAQVIRIKPYSSITRYLLFNSTLQLATRHCNSLLINVGMLSSELNVELNNE